MIKRVSFLVLPLRSVKLPTVSGSACRADRL
nr:MAG TPA: hypothetical protein [Caudoviricetes sp.]